METDTATAFPALIKKFAHEFQEILWIDSSNQAATHHFESRPELLHKVSIARAFTALQHHQLVKEVEAYDLVVIPEIDRLYAESSLYRSEAVELFESMLDSIEPPIIYSTVSELGEKAEDQKDHAIEVRSTEQGLKYSTEDSLTRSYSLPSCVQTTVPMYEEVREWEEPIKPTETV